MTICRKYLQKDFLDHGILTLLKKWLEPLPDKIMPSLDIRAAVLKILNDVREIMFLFYPFELN
jgi:transcription factor SPN1